MSSHLARRLSSFFPSLSHHHRSPLLAPLIILSFSTEAKTAEHKEIPSLAKYLISSLAFSPDRALKISTYKKVAAIKSEERAMSVVKFLKDTGLSDDQIRGVISFRPDLLSWNVENTLKPKVRELIYAGFSKELLVHLIWYNPAALVLKDTLSRLQFWRVFAGNNNEALLKIIKNNGLLLSFDIDNHVVPRINLFNEYGLSNRDIAGLLAKGYNWCMSRRLDSYKHSLDFIEEAGIPRGSGMFLPCFKKICSYSKETIERKMGVLQDDIWLVPGRCLRCFQEVSFHTLDVHG